ncbi:MAG: serine hydrolase domain-containing protein [Sphingomicrobium sp.]
MAGQVMNGFSGAVLVARHGHVILNCGYGSVHGVPMQRDTLFRISSIGKQFVSAAVVRLQREGKIDLDEPLGRLLPKVPQDKASITMRQILSHTSGLPQGYIGEQSTDAESAIRAILQIPLQAPPGTKFIYANDNYQLAAAIVERISKRGLARFEEEQLFRPLGLRGISSYGAERGIAPTNEPLPPRLATSQWGTSGHVATAQDLYRWYRALAAGNVVGMAGYRELTTGVVKIGEGEAGLGWFMGRTAKRTRTIFTRGNDDFGPNSLIYDYPTRNITIVILTHAGNKDPETSWSRAILADIEGQFGL